MAVLPNRTYPVSTTALAAVAPAPDRVELATPPAGVVGHVSAVIGNTDVSDLLENWRISAVAIPLPGSVTGLTRRRVQWNEVRGRPVVLTYGSDQYGGIVTAGDPFGVTSIASSNDVQLIFFRYPAYDTAVAAVRRVHDGAAYYGFRSNGRQSRVDRSYLARTEVNLDQLSVRQFSPHQLQPIRFSADNPIAAARLQLVTGAYIMTGSGKVDSDGVTQPTLSQADIARYFPGSVPGTPLEDQSGNMLITRVDMLGSVDAAPLLTRGTTVINTSRTPAEVDIEGVVNGIDPELMVQRGRLSLDGYNWIIDNVAVERERRARVTAYRTIAVDG